MAKPKPLTSLHSGREVSMKIVHADISGGDAPETFLQITDPGAGVLRYVGTPEDIAALLEELANSEHL